MKVALITVHDAISSRKVDFHFWAQEFLARGMDVDFITVGFSPLTILKPNSRRYKMPYNEWQNVTGDYGVSGTAKIHRYIWCAAFHPMGAGDFLNSVLDPVFSLYPHMMPRALLNRLKDADICIVENGAGLLLMPRLKRHMPQCKFIYNVCDRIETLGYHPSILRAEKTALPLFDKIRVPAQVMIEDFEKHGVAAKAFYIPHGLQKAAFDASHPSPYAAPKNVVSVGDMLFDAHVIETLADNFPDWTFHLFGRKAKLSEARVNVIVHGERPFDEIVPYITHADIGMAPYRPAMSADYLSQSSMKMIQYTYCRLPILAPHFAKAGRAHVCGYDPSVKESIIGAMEEAIAFDRESIDRSSVMGWAETADRLLEGLDG